MTNKEEKIKITESGVITEVALLAYLHDQLSPEDRHEMERLLKDDPFAQEALEGLKSAQNKAGVTDSLISIRKKVHQHLNKKEKKLLHIHWTNYAWAAVILGLLISLGTIMVAYLGKRNDNGESNKEQSLNITEQKKEEPQLIQAPVTTADTTTQNPTAVAPVPVPAAEKMETKPGSPALTANLHKDTATKPTPTLAKNKEPVTQIANKSVVADISNTDNANGSRLVANKKSMPTAAGATINSLTATSKPSSNVVAAEESNGSITSQEAMKTFYTGDYKKSATQFDEVLKQQPQDPDALFFGGISDYVNGDLKNSENNFDQLLKQHKKFMDGAKWYKANILLKQGNKEQAKKMLQELSETGGSYKDRAQKKLSETQF